MAAVAHSPEFAKKVGVPTSVGKDFNQADKGRKFAKGGDKMADSKAMKALAAHAAKPASKAHKGLKAGGSVRSGIDGVAKKGKTKGTQVAMCGGGMTKKK